MFQFQGFTSLFVSQSGNVVSLSLTNDQVNPGNSYSYGTGTDGTKGWFPISQAISGSSSIDASVGSDGVTTLSLPDVTVTSGGSLKKRAFDAKGRLSQEESATTDDLAEGGTNLYFTGARVLATTLTGLSTGTSTPVVASDSVLVSIGKLQAQVSTNATAIAGKEPTIAAGTTAQYWRGDKTWRDFATDVRAAVLTGLSTATSAAIAATDTVLSALGKLQAQITTNTTTIAGKEPSLSPGTAAQFYRGDKTWSNALQGSMVIQGTNISLTTLPGAVSPAAVNGTNLFNVVSQGATGTAIGNGSTFDFIASETWSGTQRGSDFRIRVTKNGTTALTEAIRCKGTGEVVPGADNTQTMGSASLRWSVVYAGTGAINTSDARDKTAVEPLTANELAASIAFSREIGTYQWLASVQAKGADARWHVGLTVQRAIEIMQAHGLDPFRYGFVCYDQWDEQPEIVSSWPAKDAVLDEEGNVIQPAIEAGSEVVQPYRSAGNCYSFRHDQLLLFIARGIDARLSSLEAKVVA